MRILLRKGRSLQPKVEVGTSQDDRRIDKLTKFQIRPGQTFRSSSTCSRPVRRSGTSYMWSPVVGWVVAFAFNDRGFSNATFSKSIGSSEGICLAREVKREFLRMTEIAHLWARYASAVQSMPPLKSTATRAQPGYGAFLRRRHDEVVKFEVSCGKQRTSKVCVPLEVERTRPPYP